MSYAGDIKGGKSASFDNKQLLYIYLPPTCFKKKRPVRPWKGLGHKRKMDEIFTKSQTQVD